MSELRRSIVRALSVVLLLAAPTIVGAQQTRGVVMDSVAGTPLPGAVILVFDSLGKTVARTVGDASGRFSLDRRDGWVRIRVLRLGFQPRELAIPKTETTLAFLMPRIPPLLGAVRVSDRELCPGSTDRGSAFLLLEQVRAALLGQVVANDAAVDTRGLTYRRRVAPANGTVRRQTSEVRNARALRPFVADASPAVFAAQGYMEEDASGRTFRAPDADVLLHDTFIATHCFHSQPGDAEHAGQIGLGFAPIPGRDKLVEVNGVIWIDQAARELRSFDFLYEGLEPAAVRANAGGHMTFKTAPNGVSFIDRWQLTLPILTASIGPSPTNRSTRRQDRNNLRVAEIEESGGFVLGAKWSDGTTWTASEFGLTGQASATGSGSPIRAAIVALDGIADSTTTDSSGTFRLVPLVPGRYTMTIADTSLSAFEPPRRISQVVDVEAGGVTTIQKALEGPAAVLTDACRDRRRAPKEPIVVGRIVAPSGARLSARWTSPAGDSAIRVDVDGRGRFLLCDAPASPIVVHVEADHLEADTTLIVRRSMFSVEWHPTLLVANAVRPRVIRGIVADTANRPLRAVDVRLIGGATAVTDDSGRFRFTLPTRAAVVLDIRRLGFTPSLYSLDEGSDTTLRVTLIPLAQQLARVDVVDRSVGATNLRAFDDRMRARERGAGAGVFLTGAEIEKRNPDHMTTMFTNIPGIFVVRTSTRTVTVMGRGRAIGIDKCAATVYIDGVRIQDGAGLIDEMIDPSTIAGVEVYPSGNAAPPAYQALNGSCAVVLFWTKTGR